MGEQLVLKNGQHTEQSYTIKKMWINIDRAEHHHLFCDYCGLMVGDIEIHEIWHRNIRPVFEMVHHHDTDAMMGYS